MTTSSEPPLTAALRLANGPQYDVINLRCTHRMHADVTTAYRMSGTCTNCSAGPLVGLFTTGHEAYGGECPACGCRTLSWRGLADSDPATAL
jgi:hypothetical protein